MSYANFKPIVWSKYIQHELKKFTIYKQDCDFKFEGEAGEGKKVKIQGIGRPTLFNYVPGQDIPDAEAVEGTSVYIDIDQFKGFNYKVDNIDKAQSQEGLMEAIAEETTRAIAEVEDSFIAEALAKEAGNKLVENSAVKTSEKAKELVDNGFVQLWNEGVSAKDQVTMYLPPWFYNLFKNNLVELKTNNDKLIAEGVVGMYNNAKVKMTNNNYHEGANDFIIIKTSKAYAYCNGIDKLEAYKPEKSFSDAVKGLNTFGGKMVRPKECVSIKCKNA